MKTKSRAIGSRPGRFAAAILTTLSVVLLSGCLEERVVWSPDGTRAAVVNEQGLFLCDAAGTLSPQLASDVYRAVWPGDAEHLLLARERNVDSWDAFATAIGDARAAGIATDADDIWHRLEGGGLWSVIIMGAHERKNAVAIYLREKHADELQAKVGDSWNEITKATASVQEVVAAHVADNRIEIGATVYAGIDRINELRPSRDGRRVAVVTEMDGDNDFGVLHVASADGSTASVLVAERTAAYPDWTPDDRSLVYLQATGRGASDDEIGLGILVRRRVVDEAGALTVAADRDELAGLMFSVLTRIRCLSDGRILFDAAELCLPAAASDAEMQREQFFALDPARQSTLVRLIPRKTEGELPDFLTFFAVSPDEKQLLFGTPDGDVCVFTLATGDVEIVQAKGSSLQGAPVWRRDGEFSYLRRAGSVNGQEPARKAELVLHRQGAKEETVLSRGWPDEMINALVK